MPKTKYSESLGKYLSIFQADIRIYEIIIMSDCQVAIKALSSQAIRLKIIWKCL